MILEVPFDPESWPEANLRNANNSIRLGRRLELGEHSCDGVVVEHVTFARYKQRKGDVYYWVEVGTYTQPGIDKLAMVTVEILRDSSSPPEAKVNLPKIDAEEKQHGAGRGTLSIPENLVATSPPPTLRITVSVRDNP